MKLRHPLHEFMPYGAPDLLVAHRPDLSRALTLSAFVAFSLFALMGAWSSLAPRSIERHDPRVIDLQPPPFVPPSIRSLPPAGPPKVRVNPAPKLAMPKPVVEEAPAQPEVPPGYEEFAKQVQNPGSAPSRNVTTTATPFTPAEDPDRPVSYAEVWPTAVIQVKPEYPEIAREAMIDGPVFVLVLVGRDGRVRDAKVDEHHHVPMLDEAALTAARKWVFSPATVGGNPVAVWTVIPFHFILH